MREAGLQGGRHPHPLPPVEPWGRASGRGVPVRVQGASLPLSWTLSLHYGGGALPGARGAEPWAVAATLCPWGLPARRVLRSWCAVGWAGASVRRGPQWSECPRHPQLRGHLCASPGLQQLRPAAQPAHERRGRLPGHHLGEWATRWAICTGPSPARGLLCLAAPSLPRAGHMCPSGRRTSQGRRGRDGGEEAGRRLFAGCTWLGRVRPLPSGEPSGLVPGTSPPAPPRAPSCLPDCPVCSRAGGPG